MAFNSLSFLVFLLVVLSGFAVLPTRWRWAWLLAAGLVFYGSFAWTNLVFLGVVVLIAYTGGVAIDSASSANARKSVLAATVIALIGCLAFFKFYGFLAAEFERLSAQAFPDIGIALPGLDITAPAGFSFYTFMATAYVVDVYRRNVPAVRNPATFLLFVSWFPKILAGPIERAKPFLSQLEQGLEARPALAIAGLQLILWGLVKKVVVADNLAVFVDRTFSIAAYAAPMDLLFAAYFFAFQIYCDFSGYTDIAIGVSLLFGVRLMENFRRPYLSRSVAEFWAERWHISLGNWFCDYLYIPLGGSRAGRLRQHVNLILVFVASGLWHAGLGYGVGWTFLVWGLLNGIYVSSGRLLGSVCVAIAGRNCAAADGSLLRVLRILLTFHLILISWVFFRAESVGQAMLIIERIGAALPSLVTLLPRYPFTADHFAGVSMIVALIAVEVVAERKSFAERLAVAPVAIRWAVYYAGLLALLLLGRWQAEQFIYMQF